MHLTTRGQGVLAATSIGAFGAGMVLMATGPLLVGFLIVLAGAFLLCLT